MHGENELASSLGAILPSGTRLAVVHSSLARLRITAEQSKWTFLRVFQRMADDGLTLAFPAFTFSFAKGVPFDPLRSRSETGILADWVLELGGAVRTDHPMYSFAVLGPLKDELLRCGNTTTFGDDSTFAYFERANARVVMVGCDWSYCTQFHRSEETAGVPYRFYKDIHGKSVGNGEEHSAVARMFVRDLDIDPTNDFQPLIDRLRSRLQISSTRFGSGLIESASCTDIAEAASDVLQNDRWSLVSQPKVTKYRAACLQESRDAPPLKVAVLGNSNVQFLREKLQRELADHIPNRRIEMFSVPYGQVAQQIVDPKSDLAHFRADMTFFVDRPEDLLGVSVLDLVDLERVRSAVQSYIELVKSYRGQNDGWIFVNSFAPLGPSPFGVGDNEDGFGPGAYLKDMDSRLRDSLNAQSQLLVFDLGIAAASHASAALDPRLWHLGRFPFSDSFTDYLARRYTGLVLSATGRTVRLLLVDLDNTLWGGVLGEDGVAGIQLGGDYPGNAFVTFQRALKKLSDRGIGLAVCSKNDEAPTIDAMNSIAEMVIKPDDLISHRINWAPKFENAQEILADLNLGLGSAMLIDDNPSEREQMRQQCPEIKVLDLPDDPALFTNALLESPWLESVMLTSEDFQRVAAYKSRGRVRELKSKFADLTEFYASLDVRLHFHPLDESNAQRALQLLGKTNQFNTTTRRHNLQDLKEFLARGDDVIVIGAEDRFSSLENVGLIITRWNYPTEHTATVDSYLLSCRVLGKGIEDTVVAWLKIRARSKQMNVLRGEIVVTERNSPAHDIYERAGFSRVNETGISEFDLGNAGQPLPSWLTIHDRVNTFEGEAWLR